MPNQDIAAPVKKASNTRTLLFVVTIIGLILVGIIAFKVFNNLSDDSSPNQSFAPSTSSTESTDPVKKRAGSNGDTQPSPTGTAPDGNNSLLSQ